jgi:hypothetical protein
MDTEILHFLWYLRQEKGLKYFKIVYGYCLRIHSTDEPIKILLLHIAFQEKENDFRVIEALYDAYMEDETDPNEVILEFQ